MGQVANGIRHARLGTGALAARFLRRRVGRAGGEGLCVAHFSASAELLGLTEASGTGDAVALPLRRILADALALDARMMIAAHNHPGGDPAPSHLDLEATRTLAEVAAALDIALRDHLIFAGQRLFSFRAAGLL